MPPYEWVWEWHAETGWKSEAFSLSSEQIDDFFREKVAEKLIEEYVKKGYSISVDTVATQTNITVKTRTVVVHRELHTERKYIVEGKTTTIFDTNAPVFGSPIDPVTLMVLAGVISSLVGLATVILYFVILYTVVTTVRDVGTGISETLGIGKKGGLAVFILLILLLIGLYVVGKYFWRKRR